MNEKNAVLNISIGGFIGLLILIFGWPNYSVWEKEMAGKAQLREAEWTKQIAIEEAKAKFESAALHAQAEVERAKGVAEANEIIGDSLKGNNEYLKYLMIDSMRDMDTQLIYIPTEAGLPILEARNK